MYKKIFTLVMCVGLIFSYSLPVSAADKKLTVDKDLFVVEETKGGVVITSGVGDKKVIEQAVEDYLEENTDTVSKSSDFSLYDFDSESHTDGDVSSRLESDLDWWGLYLRVDGIASVTWSGNNPYNCDTIEIEETWKTTGVAVSMTFPDFSVTGGLTSKEAVYEKEYDDKFSITHNYSNHEISGTSLYTKQSVTGRFEFGTLNYSVTASDYAFLY